ncbi:hypothetical protein V8C40DRAFT_151828 [Trichoderma camerunense]
MQNELPDSPASTIFVQAKTSTPQWSRPQTFLKAVPMQSRWSADNTSLVGLLSSPRQNDPSASPSSSRCPLWPFCALRHDYMGVHGRHIARCPVCLLLMRVPSYH